jgi:hypothetical protein
MKNYVAPIKKEITVQASQQTAFDVFTQQMDTWWPRTHHTGNTPMTELLLESGDDGRWYSKHEDGSEVEVGKVIRWDPYSNLLLNWQIDGNFKYNPSLTTEVEVQFIAIDPTTTKVIMEHRNLDRLVEGKVIDSMDMGWGMIMEMYKQTADNNSII